MWFSILLAAVLILVVVIYLFISNILNIESKPSEQSTQDTIKQEQELLLSAFDINKAFTGTRESMDGSVEPVLFEINSVDSISNSFEFTLNIGLSKKVKGYGSMNLSLRKINADVVGELVIIIDANGRVNLKTAGTSNNKFNLIEEVK
jgi:hypothetical protein